MINTFISLKTYFFRGFFITRIFIFNKIFEILNSLVNHFQSSFEKDKHGDIARFNQVLSGSQDFYSSVLRLVGLLATLSVVWLVSRAARRALQDSSELIS